MRNSERFLKLAQAAFCPGHQHCAKFDATLCGAARAAKRSCRSKVAVDAPVREGMESSSLLTGAPTAEVREV
jgi:hypothetical protein